MSGNSAPVYSLAEEQRSRAEAAAWSRFVSAADRAEFCAGWLSLLAARINRARAALLLISDEEGAPFSVAAAWPDPKRDLQYLGPVAERALLQREGVVTAPDGSPPDSDGAAYVGYPVEVAGRLVGAIVLDVGAGSEGGLQSVLRQVHWASAWLLDFFVRQRLAAREAELARVTLLEELMATALQHRKLKASALGVANELATQLRCDRVSVGLEENGQTEVVAMSHAATFDRRSDLVSALGDAMDEVLDLGVPLVLPAPAGDELSALTSVDSARVLKAQALLSVPLQHDGQTIGALVFERSDGPPFDADEQRLARAIGVMLGPVWALQRSVERPWWQHARDAYRSAVQATFGPSHPGLKLGAAVLGTLLLAGALVQIDHRVAARTVIEGSTQRASVAPFDGFIAEGLVRAGDSVRAGQPMARLDERDLTLERARWNAEREQLKRKYQVAMAGADLSAMGVIGAQIAQSEAQLALAQEKLARATVVAPFDGLIVSGDLSQSIGMPVEQGALLFEVAPLEGYRVILQVDDRDITRIALGQPGELVLSSLPDRALPFTVSAVTPVATQVDGRNVFRVEAMVDGQVARLRPGMEGIGKVVVGERSVLWVWTHNFFDWLRLALWNWLP